MKINFYKRRYYYAVIRMDKFQKNRKQQIYLQRHRATGTNSLTAIEMQMVQTLCGFLFMKPNTGYLAYDLAVAFLIIQNALKTWCLLHKCLEQLYS